MRRLLSWSWPALLLALAALPGCARNDGKPRVAFVSNNAFDFWTITEKGTQKGADEFGVRADFRKPPQGSAQEQQQIVEDLVNSGYKGLAVSPNDSANSVEFFRQINARVPLVMVDSDLPDPTARRCYLGTHNYRAGREVGKLVTRAVPAGGKIAIFVGALDVQNAVERRQGVIDYLTDPNGTQMEIGKTTPTDARDLKVGKYVIITTQTDDRSEERCQERCQEILLQNPDLVCLVGLWEYNPPALLRAVKSSKLQKAPTIVGFDENYQTLEGIQAGDVYATVVQNPYEFGRQSVKILAGLAKGDEGVLKSYPGIDEQKRIYVEHRVVNKDNVDTFYKDLKVLKGK